MASQEPAEHNTASGNGGPRQRHQRISVRLALTAILVAIASGVALSVIQTVLDLRQRTEDLDERIDRILAVAANPAQRSVLMLETSLAQEVVSGLLKYPFVVSASIFDDRGEVLAQATQPPAPSGTQWITRTLVETVGRYEQSLDLPPELSDGTGKIVLEVDRDTALKPLYRSAITSLWVDMVRNAVLVLLLFFAFQWQITRPLVRLAQSVGRINLRAPADQLVEIPAHHRHNEFGLVATRLNRLLERMQQLIDAERDANEKLRRAQDVLEERVRERTESLMDEVSRRKSAEEELRQANSDLEQRVQDRTQDLLVEVERQRQTAQTLADLKAEAEAASRAKTEFLANMSHELRTPLNAIIGFSSMMEDEVFGKVGNDRYKAYVSDIRRSSEHLSTILTEILDLARVESGKMKLHEEPINIGDVIEESTAMFKGLADQGGIDLKVDVADDLPAFVADPVRLRQVLINLVSNSVKFTPKGGEVTVSARRCPLGGLELSVRDTGRGIEEHDLKRVLEPFTQSENVFNRSHEGAGLGLSLANSLVIAHGGSLHLDSKPNQGTLVQLNFPAERWAA